MRQKLYKYFYSPSITGPFLPPHWAAAQQPPVVRENTTSLLSISETRFQLPHRYIGLQLHSSTQQLLSHRRYMPTYHRYRARWCRLLSKRSELLRTGLAMSAGLSKLPWELRGRLLYTWLYLCWNRVYVLPWPWFQPGNSQLSIFLGVLGSTTTVIVNPTVTASPPAASTFNDSSKIPVPTTASTTVIVPNVPPTTEVSSSPSSTPASSTSTSTSTSSSAAPTSTSSGQVDAPVRPTSLDAATITTTTTTSPSSCPTGFYQCLAYYHGGCCRVGRDCGLSDCPSTASTTIAETNGVTIVAPTGNGIGAASAGLGTGSCASGWSSCATTLGGGCCPGGYGCGTGTTCTATSAGETPTNVAKEPTSGAHSFAGSRAIIMAAVVGMVVIYLLS